MALLSLLSTLSHRYVEAAVRIFPGASGILWVTRQTVWRGYGIRSTPIAVMLRIQRSDAVFSSPGREIKLSRAH